MKEKIKPLYLVIKKIFNGMLIFSDIGWCFFFGGGGGNWFSFFILKCTGHVVLCVFLKHFSWGRGMGR